MQYPGTTLGFMHLFPRDQFGYRRQDGIHRSRDTGVHSNMERGVSGDNFCGRRETIRSVTYGTLCLARFRRGGPIHHVTQ